MNTQYFSIIPMFQKFSQILRKQLNLKCPKDFIQFLIECLVNLLRGELQNIQKEDLVKCRKENSESTRKNLVYPNEELF